MKKSQRKKTTKENRISARDSEHNLYDLGIEPPKIYRESQRSEYAADNSTSRKSARKNKMERQNLTRAEKRHKDNKKRKKRNTFRKIMIWFAAIIAFAAVGTVLSLTVFFHIDTISVSGNEIYSKDEILAQCPIEIGENLFLSDTKNAKEMLEQNLPYIYNAEITRKLPYTIQIKITEATPQYSIKQDKTYILLDDNFKVLENNAEKAQGILINKAEISSAQPGSEIVFKDSDIGECLQQLAAVVNGNDFSEITSIYSNSIRDN